MMERDYTPDIVKFLKKHPEMIEFVGVDDAKIAKAMMVEAINNTAWAEDAYPGLKERILKAVELR